MRLISDAKQSQYISKWDFENNYNTLVKLEKFWTIHFSSLFIKSLKKVQYQNYNYSTMNDSIL